MQGSGSGALSSFDDMLMNMTISFLNLCVVLDVLFFFCLKCCRLIFSPMNQLPASSSALSLSEVSGAGAILRLCALSATDTLRGGFRQRSHTCFLREKETHFSLCVLCIHNLPFSNPLLHPSLSNRSHLTFVRCCYFNSSTLSSFFADPPASLTFPKEHIHTHTRFCLLSPFSSRNLHNKSH